MLIVRYIKQEECDCKETAEVSVSSQGRKCIIGNQVQTPVVDQNVTVDWPDILGKTRLALCRIISLRLPQHQQDWYVTFQDQKKKKKD